MKKLIKKYQDPFSRLYKDMDELEKNKLTNIVDSNTGETGHIIKVNQDGTYKVSYPSGTYDMTLDLPNTDVLGKKAHMRAVRRLDIPTVGGELRNNQYRTQPTNKEASNLADEYVAATEFGPGAIIGTALKPLDVLAPSRWVGLLDSDNNNGILHLFDDNNKGFFINNDPNGIFNKRYVEEHPYLATAGNLIGDIGGTFGIIRGANQLYNLGNKAIDFGFNTAARMGNNYARARQISRAINGAVDNTTVVSPLPIFQRVTQYIPSSTEVPTINYSDIYKSKLDWTPENWFTNISKRKFGYTPEEALEFESFVPEYKEIEERLFKEGKLVLNPDGSVVVKGSDMSPQEYIMRQSKNFQKMNQQHHYVGVNKSKVRGFEAETRFPGIYDVWSDRRSPKNIEEYAYSGFGGVTVDRAIDRIKSHMDDVYKLLDDCSSKYKQKMSELGVLRANNLITDAEYILRGRGIITDYNTERRSIEMSIQYHVDQLNNLRKQKLVDPLNGGRIYDITYPEGVPEVTIDAENSHWAHIPVTAVERDAPDLIPELKNAVGYIERQNIVLPSEIATDDIVAAARANDYGVTHINNVMDTGNGTYLDESIVGRNTPVKSVLGNTGRFETEDPVLKWKLYRQLLLPLGLGASTYGLSNYNNGKVQ